MNGPLALIAEVTHRCPLHCVYCSNPLELSRREEELDTAVWASVFVQAAGLGALHAHLTGGEPLARTDLVEMVSTARSAGLYVNLVTSGIGLGAARLDALVAAGLDHVQLSFQDAEPGTADEIAGAQAHLRKLAVAREIAGRKIGLTINAVVHRRNLVRLSEIIAMAEELGAGRLEIAHVQYYGWAVPNREALLPTREQVAESLKTIEAAQARLEGRMRIEFVVPDYYAKYPKACMGGWGQKLMLVSPSGAVLPCHAAGVIPGMRFENVRERPLRWIWEESSAFQRFRGEAWMPEPCRSCERRTVDFGGCRCQAMLLAGDAAATDPVCSLAPSHHLVEAALSAVNAAPADAPRTPHGSPWVYRINPA